MPRWPWKRDTPETASGIRPPKHPPPRSSKIEILFHYLDHFEQEFVRARLIVKSRASKVVVGVAAANGGIAVAGAVTAVSGEAGLGVISTGLAARSPSRRRGTGIFRHRELWVQRTLVASDLQTLRRQVEMRRAGGEDANSLADAGMVGLNAILEADMAAWSEVRRAQQMTSDTKQSQRDGPAGDGPVT
ncbi:hypothetical protein GCM10010531_08220 [Blastococcus jejuensis]|uniref:Uncharacterized protein n=1 Tax=Blastococcus jejuensis TaxID=351224 RepID=A0ABP6NVJ3_9ACTN